MEDKNMNLGKLSKQATKLFHDINKPVLNTYMILKTNQHESGCAPVLDILFESISKCKTVLNNFNETLDDRGKLYFENTVEKYTNQFNFLEKLLSDNLADNLSNKEYMENILYQLKQLDQENNEFANRIIGNLSSAAI